MNNQKYRIRLNTSRILGEHTINSLPLKGKNTVELILVPGAKTWLCSILYLKIVL